MTDSKTLRTWAEVDPGRNLFWLLIDYLTVTVISGLAIWFQLGAASWGIHQGWVLPVWGVAFLINGCLQHRIGLMGHEASHSLLIPNRKWNDVLAELLCFYPVYGSLIQYRAKHLQHHLHPNDHDLDPNLGNGKAERLYAKFPMPKPSFIYHYYLKFFWPPFVLANLLDLLDVVTIGSGMGPVADKKDGQGRRRGSSTMLGIIYLIALTVAIRLALHFDRSILLTIGGVYAIGVIIWKFLPDRAFVQKARLSFPTRVAAWMRLTYYTAVFSGLGLVASYTGYDPTLAYFTLWVFPLLYVFPYLMILREIYQHANAGTGKLDNSRVIHSDPFTRWAVLGYGNDFHLIHHLYPNIPQYRLREAHESLTNDSKEYRKQAEEIQGIFRSRSSEHQPLLDSLSADKDVDR